MLQVDPRLIQTGLPSRLNLTMNGQSSGSTIEGSISLMQGGDSECITAEAVVVIVRTHIAQNILYINHTLVLCSLAIQCNNYRRVNT